MGQRHDANIGARIVAALRAEVRRLAADRPSEQSRPVTTATWDTFRDGLTVELRDLETGSKVIIGDVAYVQVAMDADRLYAETVSNRFLPPDMRLSSEDEQRLTLAGWQPPDRKHENWWLDRTLPLSPDDYAQVAELAVITLRDVLHIAEPSALEYRAWNDRTSEALDLPALHPTVAPPSVGETHIT